MTSKSSSAMNCATMSGAREAEQMKLQLAESERIAIKFIEQSKAKYNAVPAPQELVEEVAKIEELLSDDDSEPVDLNVTQAAASDFSSLGGIFKPRDPDAIRKEQKEKVEMMAAKRKVKQQQKAPDRKREEKKAAEQAELEVMQAMIDKELIELGSEELPKSEAEVGEEKDRD